jgi:hypothetical protein
MMDSKEERETASDLSKKIDCEDSVLLGMRELAKQINDYKLNATQTASVIHEYLPEWKAWWESPQQ